MKINKILLPAALLLTTACAHVNRESPALYDREPASLLDSCKNALSSFFKTSYAETTPTSKVAKEGATDAANQVDRNYVVNNHKNNTFTTGRGLNHYKSSFNRRGYPVLTFSSDLEKIMNNPKAHWLDAGGGMGFATGATVVDTYISYLRRKVHVNGFAGIKTIRGVGFQIEAP